MKDNLEKEYEELKRKIRLYNEKCNFALVEKAWEFAKLAHHGQMRASGDPYFIHSLKTAEKLAEWKLDTTSIVVGLLHDTVEKGGATNSDIRDTFGESIEMLVDGVTEISEEDNFPTVMAERAIITKVLRRNVRMKRHERRELNRFQQLREQAHPSMVPCFQ